MDVELQRCLLRRRWASFIAAAAAAYCRHRQLIATAIVCCCRTQRWIIDVICHFAASGQQQLRPLIYPYLMQFYNTIILRVI